jgi:peptidoglycan hydrolase CwlO-like protein
MRKKRRITKTAMVKTWFLLLAITAGLLTSCKDYDDDIDRLDEDIAALEATLGTASTDLATLKTQIAAAATDSEVATAVNTAKTAAVTEAKAYVDGLLTTLRGGYTGTMDDLNDELTDIAAQLTALGVNVTGLTARLDAAEVQIAANKAAIELQQAVLDKYLAEGAPDNLVDAINDVKDDLAALQASTTTDLDALEAAVADLQEQINAINGGLNVLDFVTSVNAMITNITFLNSLHYGDTGDPDLLPMLGFTTTVAKQTLTFAPGVEGAISFVEGERLLADESAIVVQVSPSNADLSKMLDKIYLIDSEANTAINNYIKPVKAERYTELFALRSAPTVTGLWKITFELPAESNYEALEEVATTADGDAIFYALAIENKVVETEADRHVESEFACIVGAMDVDGIGELGFEVKGANATNYVAHTELRNRYGVTESGITAPVDYRWAASTDRLTGDATTEDDPEDVRSTSIYDFVEAGVGQAFYVRLNTAGQDSAYAYYVALDKDWAVESSPSEINAWNSYSYEGLNKNYMANEVATLKINSQAANGDIIGFRVFAVNADGTLVDPDGKSFYVYVGDLASSALAFEQTFANQVYAAGTPVPSNKVAFAPTANLANVATAEFTMNIGTGSLNNDNLQLLGTGDVVLGDADLVNWSAVKKLQIIGVDPARMQENAMYTGTLILKNSLGVAFSQTIITFKKILPTFTPGADIAYKTNILHSGVIYGYPKPDNSYDLTTAFNIASGIDKTRLTVTNNSGYANLPAWTGTVADVDDIIISSTNVYDLTMGYNYGYILFNGTQFSAPWDADPDIKVNFRSYVQDLTGWRYTTAPALQYATDATYNVVNIKAMPPAGSEINMTQNESAAGNLQDGRAFTITGVKVLTGATFTTVNEYFTPTFDAGTEIITLDAVITSPPAGPVPTKLQLKLTDDFGHSFTFTIDATFNMVLN